MMAPTGMDGGLSQASIPALLQGDGGNQRRVEASTLAAVGVGGLGSRGGSVPRGLLLYTLDHQLVSGLGTQPFQDMAPCPGPSPGTFVA